MKNSINPDNSIVANYRRGDLRDLLRRIDGIGHARFATIMVLIYVALSLFAYLPAWPGDPHRLVGCACGDPVQQAWFLGWLPWAMLHGHNLFFTNWMEYPPGVNLSNNTEMRFSVCWPLRSPSLLERSQATASCFGSPIPSQRRRRSSSFGGGPDQTWPRVVVASYTAFRRMSSARDWVTSISRSCPCLPSSS